MQAIGLAFAVHGFATLHVERMIDALRRAFPSLLAEIVEQRTWRAANLLVHSAIGIPCLART
jgi:hypothetical protein